MAALPDTDRLRIRRGFSQWLSHRRQPFNLSKPDFGAAIAATDAWIDSNAAAYNAALPLPARTTLTPAQKTLLFVAVALTRHDTAWLQRIFPEVD